ncbi:AAA family ATPase [Chryseobacterium scophthalmum]|uniref:AAA family ATPase n=1 Tax=Chryseobacterium scophthalmum TaxID=59733 RepID=UPI000C9DFCB3|nr:AAA family ATPase [Chryseobacterium scophthalmum]
MSEKFDIIFLNKNDFESYYNEKEIELERLNDLSKVNILIGANNSGKSRFIRNFLKCKTCFYENRYHMQNIIVKFNTLINSNHFGAHNLHQDVTYQQYQNDNREILFKNIEYSNNQVKILKLIDFNINVLNVLSNSSNLYKEYRRKSYTLLGVNKDLLSSLLNELKSMIHINFFKDKKQVFIPTLRTAHSLFNQKEETTSKISEDIFKNTIIKSYELDKDKVDIFTGLDLYYQIVNIRNDVKDKRESFEKFEVFLSENFFNNKKIEIVAKFNIYHKHDGKDDSEIINVYIDGESKDLHELGDGIQALFILMYKIYTCENESLIFIDEPEINLHPGMQRLFLEQITTNKFLKEKNLTYFISTHSNHFLDLTIEKDDISIFLFNKVNKDKFVAKNVNHGDNSALQYLGVTNSSVFLANCSIWVEGISDRNYLKAFLKAYCKHIEKTYPKEDIEFAFIEYAGSNIDHYNFDEDELKEKINAFSINNKIFLISDYDGEYKNNKHQIYEEIAKENENFDYQTTKDYKEIENVLPFKVWAKTLIYFCDKRKLKIEDEKERIKNEILESLKGKEESTYKESYIGKLLNEIKTDIPELNKIWDKAEGTLMNKAEVSYKVLELTEKEELTWEDFKDNDKIVSITREIYDFIQKSNYK